MSPRHLSELITDTNTHAGYKQYSAVFVSLQEGNKIEAIRKLRELSGRQLDLRDAKDIVEAICMYSPGMVEATQTKVQEPALNQVQNYIITSVNTDGKDYHDFWFSRDQADADAIELARIGHTRICIGKLCARVETVQPPPVHNIVDATT